MGLFKIDYPFVIISAVISLLATAAIIFIIRIIQPGLHVSGGSAIFIYIGVLSANFIIEAFHRRLDKARK